MVIIATLFLRKTEWKTVLIKVSPTNINWGGRSPNWLADSLDIGMAERDGIGRKMAEITDVKMYERDADSKDLYLKVNLRTYFDSRKKQYNYKNQSLSIGKPITLELSGILVQGLVTDIDGSMQDKKMVEKIVEARLVNISDIFPETLGVQPWIADALSEGKEVKDNKGNTIAKILEKKVVPAEKITTNLSGTILLGTDPLKKDVYLKIWLLTWERKGIFYYFDDIKVKIDQLLPLFFDDITVFPVITKIL